MSHTRTTTGGGDRVSRLSFASFRLSDIESGTEDIVQRNQRSRNDDDRETNIVVDKNHRTVKCAKRILFLVLLASAVIVSYLTYHFTTQTALHTYEVTFINLGNLVVNTVHARVSEIFKESSSLSVSYTFLNSSWPNATLIEFQARAAAAFMDDSSASSYHSVAFLPYLEDYEARQEWEQYAAENANVALDDNRLDILLQAFRGNITTRRRRSLEVVSSSTTATTVIQEEEETLSSSSSRRQRRELQARANNTRSIADGIYALQDGIPVDDTTSPPYWPIWQLSPLQTELLMYNQYSNWFGKPAIALRALSALKEPVLSQILYQEVDAIKSTTISDNGDDDVPRLCLYYPVVNFENTLVGTVTVDFEVAKLLEDSLPHTSSDSLDVVISNTCGQSFSYYIDGNTATFVGQDQNVLQLDKVVEQTWDQTQATCIYKTTVYPSAALRKSLVGNSATVYTAIVASVFVFISMAFCIYSCIVEYRQAQLVQQATQTSAIVRSLFPANVRERMFREQVTGEPPAPRNRSLLNVPHTPKIRLKNFLADYSQGTEEGKGSEEEEGVTSEPIADLFPHTTVMFADIAGFTAWSSEREPSQVFKLLESLYRKFDEVAHKLGVFKVETIGDCYVAVVGLPENVPDHAVVCARFAFEILYHMHVLTTQLEGSLGPGTSDLTLRIGLHSGPVTAGVLRGEKSRFQLFGDTMNTASRIESCGFPDRVHCSEHTATLMTQAGKGHWLTQREGLVAAKGKGEMQTYWLKPRRGHTPSSQNSSSRNMDVIEMPEHAGHLHISSNGKSIINGGKGHRGRRFSFSKSGFTGVRWGVMQFDSQAEATTSDIEHNPTAVASKKDRLIRWNVDVLIPLLSKIVTSRRRRSSMASSGLLVERASSSPFRILEEVTEIIEFPTYDPKVSMDTSALALVLDDSVKRLLQHYVTRLASLYRDNPFHNFEHASHVTMSANKLLKRIIHPDDLDYNMEGAEDRAAKLESLKRELHSSTYGISSDPLTQFAIVFSALIHDVDHTGLPNDQLVHENAEVAKRFHKKSVAEQNSLYLAWEILMEPQYESLRSCIWNSDSEKHRFRQLLVNSVMATDILDKEQQTIRKRRWDKAFFCEEQDQEDHLDMNRKATSVLEHIIQASDVAHTMQHWRIYRKWNERYYREKYFAWKHGRADTDPSVGWYEGEIWFFDNYIIPLARKLKESGVFGVSSDEYLQYALENRQEWECKGRQVCEEMLVNAKFEWEADNCEQSEICETSASDCDSNQAGVV